VQNETTPKKEPRPGATSIDYARALGALTADNMDDPHLREFVDNYKTSITATVDLMLANKNFHPSDMKSADVDHVIKLAIEAHLRLTLYSQ
jgi:hypothetical protein